MKSDYSKQCTNGSVQSVNCDKCTRWDSEYIDPETGEKGGCIYYFQMIMGGLQ